jgi:chemotaxis signal transduction protein
MIPPIMKIGSASSTTATTGAAAIKAEIPRGGLSMGSHLLVQAGEYVCALPLVSVRRVLRSLMVHPLPGSTPELEGLAEFGGEPLPVLNLARLVNAAPGANPAYPVTIVVWTGPPEARELMGLAADAALEVVDVPPGSIMVGDGGFLLGEAPVAGKVVRVINLEALGQER